MPLPDRLALLAKKKAAAAARFPHNNSLSPQPDVDRLAHVTDGAKHRHSNDSPERSQAEERQQPDNQRERRHRYRPDSNRHGAEDLPTTEQPHDSSRNRH